MKIAYVLYPDFTALDLVGPYEVISRWPDAEVHFLARSLEPVRCDCGLTVIPTDTPDTLPDPDLIVVPGSGSPVPVLSDEVLITWLREAAPRCQWTASVCTGAGLYAAAGLLEGKATTTHWGFRDNLKAMGIKVVLLMMLHPLRMNPCRLEHREIDVSLSAVGDNLVRHAEMKYGACIHGFAQ